MAGKRGPAKQGPPSTRKQLTVLQIATRIQSYLQKAPFVSLVDGIDMLPDETYPETFIELLCRDKSGRILSIGINLQEDADWVANR